MKNRQLLNRLYKETVVRKPTGVVKRLYTLEDGFMPRDGQGLQEYSDLVLRFMRRFNIGTMLSKNKWGSQKTSQIQNILKKMIEPETKSPQTDAIGLYNTLKSKIRSTETRSFLPSDFERVARTESARMKAIFQLTKYQEAGYQYVIHKTKNDNRVSEQCKKLNNREFKIETLLQPASDNGRIPVHIQCRCRYEPSERFD